MGQCRLRGLWLPVWLVRSQLASASDRCDKKNYWISATTSCLIHWRHSLIYCSWLLGYIHIKFGKLNDSLLKYSPVKNIYWTNCSLIRSAISHINLVREHYFITRFRLRLGPRGIKKKSSRSLQPFRVQTLPKIHQFKLSHL